MQHKMGFTLGEVAVTLAILTIIVTVGVPAITNLIDDNRMTASVNQMVSDLNQARTEAVTRNGRVVVCPTEDKQTCLGEGRWDSGWMIFVPRDGIEQPASPEDILRTTRQTRPLTMRSGQRLRVRYLRNGMALGTNQSLVICDDRGLEHARAVIVSNQGRARVDDVPSGRTCQ